MVCSLARVSALAAFSLPPSFLTTTFLPPFHRAVPPSVPPLPASHAHPASRLFTTLPFYAPNHANNYLKVLVAQHYNGRGAHGTRPYQWHLVIETGSDRGFKLGTVLYIRGSSAGGYKVDVLEGMRYKTAPSYRGAVAVGPIPAASYSLALDLVRDVVADWQSPYAAQDWTYAAVRKLHARRLLPELWSQEFIARQLVDAEAIWNAGDD
ncbi:hypothetical protein C8Q77DRAFT_1211685 [Trametes polyzona]|nr:hypothetical protein C8Q77DRAFT_1211685 [Trametes polyzona]